MSGTLKVDHARIHDAAVELEAQRIIIDLRLNEIERTMATLAKDGLVAPHLSIAVILKAASMQKSLLKALDSLEQYEDFLRGASETYREVDSELAQELGAGGSAARLEIDVDGLNDLKGHLSNALTALNAGKNACGGLSRNVLGHEDVVNAMVDFDHEWRKRRARLIESVDSLVSGYEVVVESLEETDSTLQSSLTKGSN